jgi:hypothetical protein
MYPRSKYPRTPHVKWSEGMSNDDLTNYCGYFLGKEVVVTLKMDGENTSMYRDAIHARSVLSGNHPSRTWVKNLHGRISHQIPFGFRICGENLYAKHSIKYKDLPSYFMLFAVYDPVQRCLSWNETVEWAKRLGLYTVPVLYTGRYDEALIKKLYQEKYGENDMEGYVIRLADDFKYEEHRYNVAKFVRKGHVRTDEHWLTMNIDKNGLAQDNPGVID